MYQNTSGYLHTYPKMCTCQICPCCGGRIPSSSGWYGIGDPIQPFGGTLCGTPLGSTVNNGLADKPVNQTN